jgi:tetratricopeptide (TPR) repeat protein
MKEQYMKKVLVTVLLAVATVVIAQQPSQPAPAGQTAPQTSGQPPQANIPVQQKTIKDPAEYNAYITALNTQDPAQKGAAMEAFAKQYPQSIVLVDALEQAMAAYQTIGNQAKVLELARRILQLNPNNIRALAIVTAIDRNLATQGNQDAMKEGCASAQTGLQQLPSWQKPAEVSEADFETLRTQMGDIFNGAAGFCALQAKNYPQARDFYTKAFQIDPTNLQDVYQLAVADLEMNPIDLNGLWYCAKAIGLAQKQNNAQAVQGMLTYCKAKYKRYHGGDDGWDQFVASTATETALPPDMATRIKPAPTPCDLAVQAVQQNDVNGLSFSDKEFILSKANCSPANKDAADKVWQSIQTLEKGGEARLEIPVKVISATSDSIEAAISDDNQAANKADMHVELEKPVTKPPAPGTMTKIVGVITKYTPDPFMFTMEKAALPTPKAPPRHTPVRKKKKK